MLSLRYMQGKLIEERGLKGRFLKSLGNSTCGQGVHPRDSWGMTANDISHELELIHSLGICNWSGAFGRKLTINGSWARELRRELFSSGYLSLLFI